jgi:hypothetical protein
VLYQDISNFDSTVYKKTAFHEDQVQLNWDSVQTFWHSVCSGELPEYDMAAIMETYHTGIEKCDLYALYLESCKSSHTTKVNNVWVYKKMNKLCPSMKTISYGLAPRRPRCHDSVHNYGLMLVDNGTLMLTYDRLAKRWKGPPGPLGDACGHGLLQADRQNQPPRLAPCATTVCPRARARETACCAAASTSFSSWRRTATTPISRSAATRRWGVPPWCEGPN